MISTNSPEDLFCDYFARWVTLYKEGAIRPVTLTKYHQAYSWLKRIAPDLKLSDVNRSSYQEIINAYSKNHEKQTTMDFHHIVKGAIIDAIDEELILKDPTKKIVIKGRKPKKKKPKFLNQYELHSLLSDLRLGSELNWDYFILLIAKTGIRFSEALALTPEDFDFTHQLLNISKTWNYKGDGGFLETKNKSSIRKIQLDWQLVIKFSALLYNIPEQSPIFIKDGKRVFNSTINTLLGRHCKAAKIPTITIHGLRHTHASVLLFAGVSIASVARRLGHANMTTTQKTYLHIIQELENQDIDIVMRTMSALN